MVEVMVGMLILVVGVLGTVTIFLTATQSTNLTQAREGGTNLARDLMERAHQAVYSTTAKASAPSTLAAALPENPTVTGNTFSVTRRSVTYNVTVTACTIDDPSDGVGQGDGTFCAAGAAQHTDGKSPPSYAASVNVLGIAVTAAGSTLATVCSAVGTNTSVVNAIAGVVSTVAPASVCPNTTGTAPFDTNPDDERLVRVDIAWTDKGSPGSISQTTILTNPAHA